jgi:anti-sigma regulatory factor (Ser/Thr protein kinase)
MNNVLTQRIEQMTTKQINDSLKVMNRKPSQQWTEEEMMVENAFIWVLLKRGMDDMVMQYEASI